MAKRKIGDREATPVEQPEQAKQPKVGSPKKKPQKFSKADCHVSTEDALRLLTNIVLYLRMQRKT